MRIKYARQKWKKNALFDRLWVTVVASDILYYTLHIFPFGHFQTSRVIQCLRVLFVFIRRFFIWIAILWILFAHSARVVELRFRFVWSKTACWHFDWESHGKIALRHSIIIYLQTYELEKTQYVHALILYLSKWLIVWLTNSNFNDALIRLRTFKFKHFELN